jgi:hypothetical protein
MNRIVTIIAVASITFSAATPAFAQNRFANEAAQRAADREEREAIRRAEHPELYEKTAAKSAEAAPVQEAAPAQEATAPAQAGEPAAAAQAPAAQAPAH